MSTAINDALWSVYSNLDTSEKIEANLQVVLHLCIELRAFEALEVTGEICFLHGIGEMQERFVSQSLSLLKSTPCYPDVVFRNILEEIGSRISVQNLVNNVLAAAISLVKERSDSDSQKAR
jgi:hypothetical protein